MHSELDELTAEFQQYFKVEHSIVINVVPKVGSLPAETDFMTAIPEPFLMAGNVGQLNLNALRSLQRLGELAEELANYLQLQAKKLDLLLHYVLQQQDDSQYRFRTLSYGGAGLSFISSSPLNALDVVEVKLFLAENAGAIFCYGQVLSCELVEQNAEEFKISIVFKRIRDEDRELLVRASLQQQARQLKLKAEQR